MKGEPPRAVYVEDKGMGVDGGGGGEDGAGSAPQRCAGLAGVERDRGLTNVVRPCVGVGVSKTIFIKDGVIVGKSLGESDALTLSGPLERILSGEDVGSRQVGEYAGDPTTGVEMHGQSQAVTISNASRSACSPAAPRRRATSTPLTASTPVGW